jgi:hypothetical protein
MSRLIGRIKLRVAGAYVFLDVPSLGVSLQWDRALRVYVKVDSVWRGRVCSYYYLKIITCFFLPRSTYFQFSREYISWCRKMMPYRIEQALLSN